MLGIDWSHTKNFAVYNGKKAEIITWPEVIERSKKEGAAAIEHGAPILYLYRLAKTVPTYTIHAITVAEERERLDLEKSDLVDAQIIYSLANKDGLKPIELDDRVIQLAYLYHQYLYALKGMGQANNLMKAMKRQFGDKENATYFLLSQHKDEFERRCESLKKQIQPLVPIPPKRILKIKGMSTWLWAGIIIGADPRLFPSKSAYRKWCGLIDKKAINYEFVRKASRAYWLCADQFIRQRTPRWREVYDTAKEELTAREGYTHPHGGAMNRLMTRFAMYVYDVAKEDSIAEKGVLW